MRKRNCKQLSENDHAYTAAKNQFQTLFQHIVQFRIVARTVMIAYYRSTADGISDKNRNENEFNIHQHAVSCNAVFTRIFKQSEIVKHSDNRRSDGRNKFRSSVSASAQYGFDFNFGLRDL